MTGGKDNFQETGFFTTYRGTVFIVLLLTVSGVFVWYTFGYMIELSGFAAGMLKASIGVTIMYVFDVYVMRSVDTITELKNGNVAYALFMVGWFILIAATISTA